MNSIKLSDLEKIKELLRKIDPNKIIFEKGSKSIDLKIKQLKNKEQEKS